MSVENPEKIDTPVSFEYKEYPEVEPNKHYHLIFNTTNGVKEFHNAEYTNYPIKTVIESYKGYSVYRKDIFPRWSIKEIIQIKEPEGNEIN